MKISAKARYAVRAVVEIGMTQDRILPLAEIEKKQGISAKFAKQILQPLQSADIIGSRRGIKGGYFLKKSPSSIRLRDILNAVEESLCIAPCCLPAASCPREEICGAKGKWMDLQNLMDRFLLQTTVQDIIEEEKILRTQ